MQVPAQRARGALAGVLIAALGLINAACGAEPSTSTATPDPAVDDAVASDILVELRGRSFRQFEPDRDGDPRKAVVLDFLGPGILVWAQYAEGAHAVDEWEVSASEYRVEWDAPNSVATIHFENPRYVQTFPEPCTDCVDVSRFSISVRHAFDVDRTAFRLNDPGGALPRPFPVFDSWTRFQEDEYFD